MLGTVPINSQAKVAYAKTGLWTFHFRRSSIWRCSMVLDEAGVHRTTILAWHAELVRCCGAGFVLGIVDDRDAIL